MKPQTVGLIGALCVLAGWFMASAVSPPVASLQTSESREPSPVLRPAEETGTLTARLQSKLRDSAAQPAPKRNPFQFARPRQTSGTSTRPAAATPDPSTLVAPPASPRFELAGIATSETPEGFARTGVLSSDGAVLLVRVGDTLPGGYQVVRIEDDSVVLTDAAGDEVILRLK